jgi:predicted Fe-Mo cluster-binding NifX family protein
MKIAIATDDGRVVSAHFSRADRFAVVTVDRGFIVARELRIAAPHDGHGNGQTAPARRDEMLARIADCSLVVARHIGWQARDRMTDLGLEPIVTDLTSVSEAAAECAAGRIVNLAQPLH